MVTFDNPFIKDQANNNPEMFMMLNQPPIFFDEIQYAPSLFRYIKLSCDEKDKKGLYYLSGSQLFKLMDMVSDSLAGRIAMIELAPLSLRKYSRVIFIHPLYQQ